MNADCSSRFLRCLRWVASFLLVLAVYQSRPGLNVTRLFGRPLLFLWQRPQWTRHFERSRLIRRVNIYILRQPADRLLQLAWYCLNRKTKQDLCQCCSAVSFNLAVATPKGSWTIFGGVASRYFTYTAVLHLLYSSFRWGSSGLAIYHDGSRYKKGWKPLL